MVHFPGFLSDSGFPSPLKGFATNQGTRGNNYDSSHADGCRQAACRMRTTSGRNCLQLPTTTRRSTAIRTRHTTRKSARAGASHHYTAVAGYSSQFEEGGCPVSDRYARKHAWKDLATGQCSLLTGPAADETQAMASQAVTAETGEARTTGPHRR